MWAAILLLGAFLAFGPAGLVIGIVLVCFYYGGVQAYVKERRASQRRNRRDRGL